MDKRVDVLVVEVDGPAGIVTGVVGRIVGSVGALHTKSNGGIVSL